jgi:hypothetical protein
MSEILIANAVKREKGYLYYVDGLGNVCRAKMARGRKKKDKKEEPNKEDIVVKLKKIK